MRVPGATYRLQFHAGFTLRDALAIVPYLHSLGVTHLYASPILKARPGSTHGYDIVDHSQLNPEVGTEEDLAALAAALRERGMGIIHDAVPNHMCVSGENAWWRDVLEHGPSSPFAGYFDIAWEDSPQPQMHGRLLLPVLGDQYGVILESGQLVPRLDAGTFVIGYHEHQFPIDPRTYELILGPASGSLRAGSGADSPDAIELASIVQSIRHLSPRGEPDPKRIEEARLECSAIRRRIGELAERFPLAAEAVEKSVASLAGKPDDPGSFTSLDTLLEAQAYRLSFWRVASEEINYRRFFDINELAALSTEREDVFRAVHATWFRWIAAGLGDGLRIDHPDGLFDPRQYLDRLQEEYRRPFAEAGREPPGKPLYVVVEKILGEGERLPADWVCDGTTGYEFINAINGLFVDSAGEKPLTEFVQRFTGQDDPWPTSAYRGKEQVLQSILSSELAALAHQLYRIARLDRRSRDFTLIGLGKALREVIASFSVYRSYVAAEASDSDKAVIGRAAWRAYRENPILGKAVFDFIRDTVMLKDPPSGPATDDYRAIQRRFAGKFQQVTAPVTAKGVEDTAFYVYNRLVSLNEVGGEPGRFGWKPDAVHAFLAERAESPGGLSPLSSHDTKRGEDVRARINVLSELPAEWADRVTRWAELNRGHKPDLDGTPVPDPGEEYLLYQTLVGAFPEHGPGTPEWPEFMGRIQQYMRKALAEAKVHTSWINPNAEYEAAVTAFIDRILNPECAPEFLAGLAEFANRVAVFGRTNSLAQTLLRCIAPGVPDTYQGTEEWDLSLVDPDNRRPVDYAGRIARLNEIDGYAVASGMALSDPRTKLLVTARALRSRRDHTALFNCGEYIPLATVGTRSDNIFAFLRRHISDLAMVVVPRLSVGLVPDADRPPAGTDVWSDSTIQLPDGIGIGTWLNAITGERLEVHSDRLAVSEVLSSFPVALLLRSQ